MSKLTKLFKHPVLFFKDSKLFGVPDTRGVRKCNNLFFVAHYGQLEQVQALIRYEGLKDNFICVLYTPANLRMPRLIEKKIDSEIVSGFFFAKLPVSPNRVHIENLIYIRRLYKSIIKSASPSRIFLLSFEAHYALIADIAEKNKIPLGLVEEGTATYKFDDLGVNLSPVVDAEKYKKEILLIEYVPFLKSLRPVLGTPRNFDEVYAAFPELLEKAFSCKKITRFILHAPGGRELDESTMEVIKKYGITKNDVIFVGQRYSFDIETLYFLVVDFLGSVTSRLNCKAFLKLHPKESEQALKSVKKVIQDSALGGRVVLVENNDFLIEPAIAHINPRAIIGIASTSLAYSPLVSPGIASISLGKYLVGKIPHDKKNKKGLEDITKHLEILKRFPDVDFVSDPRLALEVIERKNKKADKRSSVGRVSRDNFLREARLYAGQGKFWKAHCHYEWYFNGDILSIPISIHYEYFVNLARLNCNSLVFKKTVELFSRHDAADLPSQDRGLVVSKILESLDYKLSNKSSEDARELINILDRYFHEDVSAHDLDSRKVVVNLFFGDYDEALQRIKALAPSGALNGAGSLRILYFLYSLLGDGLEKDYLQEFEIFLSPKSAAFGEVERNLLESYKANQVKSFERPDIDSLYSNFLERVSKVYSARFIKNKRSDNLYVLFCATRSFRVISLEKSANILYLYDNSEGFFTFNPIRQSAFLSNFIVDSGFKRVVFSGSSWAGFGALLWAGLISLKSVGFESRCIAINPPSSVYPFNEKALFVNGYKDILNSLLSVAAGKKNLSRFGDLLTLRRLPPTLVFYSDGCDGSRAEAGRLSGFFSVKSMSFQGGVNDCLESFPDVLVYGRGGVSSDMISAKGVSATVDDSHFSHRISKVFSDF